MPEDVNRPASQVVVPDNRSTNFQKELNMKKQSIFAVTACTLLLAASVQAADVGVNLNINVGEPPRVVSAPPPPIVIQEPPEFILPSPLGFYVAVGVPYDLYFIDNAYYLYRGNGWYRAPRYDGPWVSIRHRHLPPRLREHRIERLRVIRDNEYRVYHSDRDRYRGRHFRPEKVMKERRKEEREEWKEHRKEDRENWKEERRHDREERKEGRRHGRDD